MPLPFKVPSLDTVPEAQRPLYVQKDGSFFLDVEGAVAADDVEGLKKNRDALKSEKQKLLDQYNALLESSKLTDEERSSLRTRVDELESQVMTKEELASKAVKKAREEAAADLEKVKAQAQHFQSLFTDSTIAADLTRAAQESGAYSPGQVHGLLRGVTRLEPVSDDDGKPTGTYRSLTKVPVIDGDKRIEKELPTAEAVKAFLGLPENKNLIDTKFQAGGGATGGRTSQGGGKAMTRQQFSALSPAAQMSHIKNGGAVTD